MFDFIFVLPQKSLRPIGGYKIVYEYCNRLMERGYSVAVLHLKKKPTTATKMVKGKIRSLLVHSIFKRAARWFPFREGMHLIELQEDKILSDERLAARCYVASAWDTAAPTKSLADKYQTRGLYLIQGYEIWSASEEELVKTFHLGLQNVAIARWLKDKILETGAECSYIPNGLNFEEFRTLIPPAKKNGKLIFTLFHESPLKGFDDVVKACEIVREKHPDAIFAAFGAYKAIGKIPDWMSYFFMPSVDILEKLYNSSCIYVSGSYTEGWGLTSSEAMQCGCALVVTDIPGHYDWSDDGGNALLSPPGDWRSMAENISHLLDDDVFRVALAEKGQRFIQQYTWAATLDKFLGISLIAKENE